MEEIKALKEKMKGLKDDIHTLWKEYIKAKRTSFIPYGTTALNAIIERQELRIGIRQQINSIMIELCSLLAIEVPPIDDSTPVSGEDTDEQE